MALSVMTLGDRIRQLRKQNKLSQESLANLIGVNVQNVYRYEKGIITDLPISRIEKLAQALNTTTEYLMYGKEFNNLLDHFNIISGYIDKYPYHLRYFPKEYKQELYNKLRELDTENYLAKDFSIYSTAEEFWKAINYFDLDIDDSRLIQIKPEDKKYYIDYTIYNDKQLLELDTITKMIVSLFERQDNFTEKNKKILKKFISDFYKKTM